MAKSPKKTPHQLLATYRKKRNFKLTAEPSGAGDTIKKGQRLIYMIQKHAATRLHYDFRLELDGVMKSWAVTRGPSLDPVDKRLAVHTEDHPMSYSTFEGTIPKGEYGGGTVMLWDRGHWEPINDPHEGYAKGNMKFLLHGERLRGEWHMVRMHGHRHGDDKHENWLLIKHADKAAKAGKGMWAIEKYMTSIATGRSMDQLAEGGDVWSSKSGKQKASVKEPPKPKPLAKAKAAAPKSGKLKEPPLFVAPQLATLVAQPPESSAWVHEIKFDGYRLQARISGGEVQMLTRNAKDWTPAFRKVADALKKLKVKNALLDGEVVVQEADGKSSFSKLQEAIKHDQSRRMQYYLFDLLYLNGEDLRQLPLAERKARLKPLLPARHAMLHYSEDFRESGRKVHQHACQIALEGIISKKADAPYQSGRGDGWLKSKCLDEQEMVVGGFTYQDEHPGILGALLLGYYDDGEFWFAGKVGTGFDDEMRRDLLKRLKPLVQPKMPFKAVPGPRRRGAQWVKPAVVVQIRFTEWTDQGSLRHPAFIGLREDKAANTVTREKARPLAAIHPPAAAKPVKAAAATSKINAVTASKTRSQQLVTSKVTLSHPDRVLFEPDITKGELAAYYELVAQFMLPQVANRPMSLVRCPDRAKKGCFFQRHGKEGLSPYIHRVALPGEEDEEPFLAIRDLDGLIAVTQMGTQEIHVWGSMAKTADQPDRLVFDFDPHEDVPFALVKEAAVEVRERLQAVGLESYLKTTGGKGLHVMAPIVRGPGWKEAKLFTQKIAQAMEADRPHRYVSTIKKSARVNKILIDYFRNDHTASSVAAYSTRNKPGAPVAMPIRWEELKKLESAAQFTLRNSPSHLAKRKDDPWEGLEKLKQKLPKLKP